VNETKILNEKKYDSKLDPKITNVDELLNSTLKTFNRRYKKYINEFFTYEGMAWVAKKTDINISKMNCRYSNVFKNSVDDYSKSLLKNFIEEYNKNSIIRNLLDKFTLDQMKKLIKIDSKITNSSDFIKYYLKKILPRNPNDLKIDSESYKELESLIKNVSNECFKSDLKYIALHFKLKNAIIERKPFDKNDFMK